MSYERLKQELTTCVIELILGNRIGNHCRRDLSVSIERVHKLVIGLIVGLIDKVEVFGMNSLDTIGNREELTKIVDAIVSIGSGQKVPP